MSIRIPCPNCGPRPIEEFVFGEIHVVPDSLTDPDERDLDRAFMRETAKAPPLSAGFTLMGAGAG